MGPIDLLIHLLNFAAPAAAVALLTVLFGRLLMKNGAPGRSWLLQVGANFGAGLLVLAAGLAVWGQDGRMLTYAALAMASGTVQWALQRGWR